MNLLPLGPQTLELRRQGLTYRQIAATLGISKTTALRLAKPEGYRETQREAAREAKRRRRGSCERCGTETRYGGQPGKPAVSRFCKACGAAQSGLSRIGTGPAQHRLRAFLLEHDVATFTEIKQAGIVGTNNGPVGAQLHRMRERGLIERVSHGKYRWIAE